MAGNYMFNLIFCKQLISHLIKNKKILFFEKEKMLHEKLYCPALDFPLFNEKLNCKKKCHRYNNLSPEKLRERNNLISKILGKVGKIFLIEQPFMCDYGYNIEIGENFCSNHNLIILDPAKVIFGNNVLVGPNCGFYTAIHPINPENRSKGLEQAKPIKVGNNVWIGGGVSVLAGVTIGDNSIIGAGSVVNDNIPPNTLAVGNPCKVVKYIYD